ncbi:MAG: sensor histidine kinase [Chloroflexota bacterium]
MAAAEIARVAMGNLLRLDLPEMLSRLAERMVVASRANAGAILLLDEQAQALRAGAYYGYAQRDCPDCLIPLGRGFAGRVAAERRPIAITDVRDETDLVNPLLRQRKVRALLGVPIVADGRLMGVAHVDWLQMHESTPEEVRLLGAMAAQAALAIHYTSLHDHLTAANAELEAANRRLETMIGTMPAGVAIVAAPNGAVLSANAAAEQMWGQPLVVQGGLEQVSAPYGFFHLNGDAYAWRDLPMARSLQAGQTVLGEEVLLRRPDGHQFTALVSSAPLRDSSGQVDRAVVVLQDTSGLEVERAKDQFVAVTTHELFTPLTVIKGTAQLLRRRLQAAGTDQDDAAVAAALDTIVGRANLITHMLRKLADASELQLAPLQLRHDPTDLVSLARQTIQNFRAAANGHEFVLNAPRERVVGDWDRERLGRVLANLVENAVKYSPEGGRVQVTLRVIGGGPGSQRSSLAERGRWVVVRVKDEGIGIAKEQIENIFERFYRAGPAVYQDSAGLGLGLYTANRIVAAHGGRMHVCSRQGKGSSFFFTLPLDAAQAKAA